MSTGGKWNQIKSKIIITTILIKLLQKNDQEDYKDKIKFEAYIKTDIKKSNNDKKHTYTHIHSHI